MKDIFTPKAKIILFTGNYGSGKSEVSVNYVLQLKKFHNEVSIIDLDIINPYFRCREAEDLLVSKGIKVIIPPGEQKYADLPIIVPEIKGAIQNSKGYTILDVGGEDLGAKVLSSLEEAFKNELYEFLVVINKNRPFTENVPGALKILREIEKASKLKATGLVSNTHLLEYTDLETILEGYELVKEISKETGLKIFFITAPQQLYDEVKKYISDPILPIKRILLPPHLKHL